MPTLSPSVASSFIKLTSQDVTVTSALTNMLDFRDSDNNSFDSVNMEMCEEFSVTIINLGAETVTNIQLEHSPDGVNWEPDSSVEATNYFDDLLAGSVRSLENVSNTRSFLRLRGQTASASTTVRVIIAARAA